MKIPGIKAEIIRKKIVNRSFSIFYLIFANKDGFCSNPLNESNPYEC
jgi:hypothetical protein